jgi:hypothetical protein
MSEFLFSEDEMPPVPAQAERRSQQEFAGTPRLRTPQRDQIEMHWTVTNAGNDLEQLPPMLEQITERYGRPPEEVLVDGGFASRTSIEEATALGSTVYAPLKEEKQQLAAGKDPYAAKPKDTPALKAWRARMKEAASKAMYRLRSQTAEWVNAIFRNRGMQQMPVRGQAKCQAVAVLYAITHNLLLETKLRAKAAQSG